MRAARTGLEHCVSQKPGGDPVCAGNFHDDVQDQGQSQKPDEEVNGVMEGRFQDTGFFLTVAVGTDLIHIPSLALFEEDQIHEITGDDTDDDLRDHELQDIASPAGIGQQKNDGLVRGGEIDGKEGFRV